MPATGKGTELRRSELHVRSSSTGQEREGCKGTRHGTATAYQVDGCRCPDAVTAQSLYRRRLRWRHRRGAEPTVDCTGTRRRVHALMAIGWARADIMARLGYSDSGNWLTKATRVNRRTAERVTALYDRLSATPGPSRQTAAWTRRRGYLPPLWWDDERIDDPAYDPLFIGSSPTTCTPAVDPIVVERLIDGQPPLHVTKAERAEAVHVLDARGWTHSLIAQQLAMSGSRVAQILDGFVRPTKHTPHADNNRQEASA